MNIDLLGKTFFFLYYNQIDSFDFANATHLLNAYDVFENKTYPIGIYTSKNEYILIYIYNN